MPVESVPCQVPMQKHGRQLHLRYAQTVSQNSLTFGADPCATGWPGDGLGPNGCARIDEVRQHGASLSNLNLPQCAISHCGCDPLTACANNADNGVTCGGCPG